MRVSTDADGAWRSVSTLARVAHLGDLGDGETRVGLEFDDPEAPPLDPVVEYLGRPVNFAERIDLIPPKYNSASTLTCAVDPSGKLTIDFELE